MRGMAGKSLTSMHRNQLSEFFDPSVDSFVPGPSLPFPTRDHCAVEVSPGLVFVAGGSSTSTAGDPWAYVLEVDTGEWQSLPDLPTTRCTTQGDAFY